MIKMTISDYVAYKQLKEEAAAEGVTIVLDDISPPKAPAKIVPLAYAPPSSPMSRYEGTKFIDQHVVATGMTEIDLDVLLDAFNWGRNSLPTCAGTLRGAKNVLSRMMTRAGYVSRGKHGTITFVKCHSDVTEKAA